MLFFWFMESAESDVHLCRHVCLHTTKKNTRKVLGGLECKCMKTSKNIIYWRISKWKKTGFFNVNVQCVRIYLVWWWLEKKIYFYYKKKIMGYVLVKRVKKEVHAINLLNSKYSYTYKLWWNRFLFDDLTGGMSGIKFLKLINS